ncbi:regulator of microtubule dynamics protein 3-like [Stylophora pistillata]|uniref:regulator of microtubule dynamics protein 3-like n=1 Tax=Stylophora pistillata TaxID=50429 RepID=UPI000C0392AA|nr:regulator of microtubule dynamics protein 3-like [Stylophora pistillata]
MASVLLFDNFGFSSSFGRNILVGISIGLGIGIGIGAGMAASRKWFSARGEDQNIVVKFTELKDEIRELRCIVVRLELTLTEGKNKRIVPKNETPPRMTVQSDEETEDEFYEMSGEGWELSSRASDFDQLKAIIDEVDQLHSNNETAAKQKIHGLLQKCLQNHQNCEVSWRYARSCYDIAVMKGNSGDTEGKKNMLYEGIAEAEKAIELDKDNSNAHKWISMLSWWQRKAASAFVAEPPSSSVDEALQNFHKAEELQPGFWLTNSFWIGKCYKQNGDVPKAKEWLKKALSLPVSSDDDKESSEQAQKLLVTL